jgi:hypothetical protein
MVGSTVEEIANSWSQQGRNISDRPAVLDVLTTAGSRVIEVVSDYLSEDPMLFATDYLHMKPVEATPVFAIDYVARQLIDAEFNETVAKEAMGYDEMHPEAWMMQRLRLLRAKDIDTIEAIDRGFYRKPQEFDEQGFVAATQPLDTVHIVQQFSSNALDYISKHQNQIAGEFVRVAVEGWRNEHPDSRFLDSYMVLDRHMAVESFKVDMYQRLLAQTDNDITLIAQRTGLTVRGAKWGLDKYGLAA